MINITADWQDCNDYYTGTPDDKITVRYSADEDDLEGYFYEMYVRINDEQANIIVTPRNVFVDFKSGKCIHTNLVPKSMFPNHETLKWENLKHIIVLLKKTGIEGMTYSAKHMTDLIERWQKEN